jgi:uncharacterized protein YprB with RNaseH-like and TPR domain
MDSLSDKLKALGVKIGAQDVNPPAAREDHPIDSVVSGRYQSTIYGEVFCVETIYSSDYTHGNNTLKVKHPLKIIAEWSQAHHLAQADPEGFVFLDTETTGLAGGTGTFAFLVGLGRFKGDDFQLAQYFMRDPSEESALLAAVAEFIHPCQALVTFNGKSFDVPLLNTRYTLQAISSPFTDLTHVDLLPLARRLWRDRLPSRALGYLETSILGAARTQEEVPGWLIPQYYFDYLKSRDARPLQGVFYHNGMDILSLAALFSHTNGLLAEPLGMVEQPGLDVVALGKLYEDLGYLDIAVQLYERGLEIGMPEEFFWRTVARFAALFKRERDWKPAVRLWQKAADHGDLYAFIELAKYYEHEARQYNEAIEWTQAAIERLNSDDFALYFRRQSLPEFERRLKRLKTHLT